MEVESVGVQCLAEIEEMNETLDRLTSVPWFKVADEELLDVLQAAEVTTRRLFAVHVALAGQLDRLGLAKSYGCSSTAVMIRQLCRVSVGESNARVRAAKATLQRRQMSGAVCEPTLPLLASAVADGSIGPESANVIERFMHRLPTELDEVSRNMAEATIVEQAVMGDANDVRCAAAELLLRLDPDGKLPIDRRARMSLTFGVRDQWGMTTVRGQFDDETVERLRQAVESLSAPAAAQDGVPDQRSAANRRACALGEVMQIFLNMGAAPSHGGSVPNVTVFMTAADFMGGSAGLGGLLDDSVHFEHGGAGSQTRGTGLEGEDPGASADRFRVSAGSDVVEDGSGDEQGRTSHRRRPVDHLSGHSHIDRRRPLTGRSSPSSFAGLLYGGGPPTTSFGGPVSAEQARRIACDAKIIPVVLGGKGEILDVGRAQYSFPRAIRRALEARDRGCAMPGCDRPAAWTAAHHIVPWSQGGVTALHNGVLLCDHHHHLIHHSEWEVRLGDDGNPEFLPPAWIDWERKPRRNHRYAMLGVEQ